MLLRAVLIISAVLALLPTTSSAATIPGGFTDEQVLRVTAPIALAFTPDGRMLVATQSGLLKLRDGAGRVSDALDLRPRICANSERGLLGVAVDAGFARNRFIYAYYTFDKTGDCRLRIADGPVNRVSRFVLGDDGVARDEVVLIDDIPSFAGNHNGGDLAFGSDGFLYVTVGDGGCNFARPSKCGADNDAARDPSTLLGKVLRVDRNGAAPDANGGGAICARGRAPAGQRCRETFAAGFRNPFRMAIDPDPAGGRVFVNDVGQATWEEVNDVRAGGDHGWNVREGRCRVGSRSDCPPTPADLTDPVFAYPHTSGCRSITGGAFVPDGAWPVDYDDSYLYSDYVCGTIFRLSPTAGGWRSTPIVTGLGSSSAVHLAFGPGPLGPSLYYTSYAGGGEVRRLSPSTAPTGRPGTIPAPPAVGADPGNERPEVTIDSSTGRFYEFGERVTIEGSARDAEDGLLPASALAWNVVLDHDRHTHPFLRPESDSRFSFEAPLPEDRRALRTTALHVVLVATDSRGAEGTGSLRLEPRRSLSAPRAKLSVRRFDAGRPPVRLGSNRQGRPSELRARLSARATLRLSRERARSGRVAGRRCVTVTGGNRGARRCVRWVDVKGTYRRSLPAGIVRLRFAGRLRAGERVPAGRYRLVVRASDVYGRRSPVQRIGYAVR